MSGAPIRVFLLSSNRFLTEGLARVMRKTADILAVGARPYSVDALVEIIELSSDLLLTDSVSALTVDSQMTDELRLLLSQLKVVVIEIGDRESVFSELARQGAMGYLSKDASVADIISMVRSVARGNAEYPPRLGMLQRSREGSTRIRFTP